MKMVEIIPNERIQFKPYDGAMSAAELVCHILSVMQIHIHAISEGYGIEEHAQRISVDPVNINTTGKLIEHLNKVLRLIRDKLAGITPEVLEREIVYKQWNDYKIQGWIALTYIIEEFFHHRGQLSVYLRLMDLKPPFLYTY